MEHINHLLSNENILWEQSHRAKFDERLRYLPIIVMIVLIDLGFLIYPIIQFVIYSLILFIFFILI